MTSSRTTGSRYLSPLRYPGGKGRLASFVAELIAAQRPRPRRYLEPFAGGAGVALSLLYHEHVDEIVLNDVDAGVAAFWRSLFHQPAQLIQLVRTTPVTIDEWHRQREIHERRLADDIELGYATFSSTEPTDRASSMAAPSAGSIKPASGSSTPATTPADSPTA